MRNKFDISNFTSKLKHAVAFLCVGSSLFLNAAAADDLSKVKSAGEIRIAMTGEYPPFNFVSTSNEVVGFDPAVGKEIANRMGIKAKVVTTAWDGIIAGLLAEKFDAIVGSMTITPAREKVVDFVGPYYHSGRGIFVAADSAFKSLADLKGKVVGVGLGETHEKWAREQGGWEIKTYKGLPVEFLELNAGRIDAIIADIIPMAIAIKDGGQKLRQLDTPNIDGGRAAVGIAIRKGNPELKAAMQKALDEMIADGTHKKLAMQWLGRDIR